MNPKHWISTLPLLAAALAVVFLSSAALAQTEKKITRTALPPAVRKTVDAQSKGATVKGYSKEVEKGKTYYEAELMVNGHTKDILVDASGNVVEVEEEVVLQSLPQPVKDGLAAKAGKGKIAKVESLTKRDKLVAYEAQVTNGTKRSEVQVGPDGKPLDHEE